MPILTVAMARDHLRDPDDDDPHIWMLINAAEESVAEYLNRRVYGSADDMAAAVSAGSAGDQPMVANDLIRAACLLIVGHLYANREAVVTGTIATRLPVGPFELITPYRVGWGI